MARNLIIFLLLYGSGVVFAQEPSTGKVTYEQVVKLEIKLEGAAAQYAGMLPKERRSEKILWFSQEATLFENGTTATPNDMSMHSGEGNVVVRMAEPENKVFTDLSDGSQVEQRDFMTRMFLIEQQPARQWKLTGQQKMILDYPCQEAVMGEGDKKVSAWFTPVIPVSSGPAAYGGLPGLILAVEINEGRQVFTAVKIESELAETPAIVRPDKGRKVTREEFDKIVEEKMKEMGAQPGAGGQQMMIRIHR
jgi:GLPGLI family protein